MPGVIRIKGRRSKYGAVRTTVDGIRFDSKAEAARYSELKIMKLNGDIRELTRQLAWPLVVKGVTVCKYVSDFSYFDSNGKYCVEDVKGYRTREYTLKKKLMLAIHGIEIYETGSKPRKRKRGKR